jgi:ribosome modulation factor
MARVLNGDNGGGISSDVFWHHVRAFEDLERQMNSIKGKIGAQKKLAIDDGLILKDLDKVKKERAMTVDDQIASFNRQNAYRRFFKMPVAAFIPVLADVKDETGLTDEERQQKWEDEGYVAGKLGLNRDTCPHDDPNSLGARYWMAGYDKGQGELAKGFKQKKPDPKPAESPETKTKPKDEPEVAAAKARGGRKPKEAAPIPPVDPVSKTGTVGITYWHDIKGHRVIENKDGSPPVKGWENITRPEFDKLFQQYKAEADAEWETQAANKKPEPDTDESAGGDDDGDDNGDADVDEEEEAPPVPGKSH